MPCGHSYAPSSPRGGLGGAARKLSGMDPDSNNSVGVLPLILIDFGWLTGGLDHGLDAANLVARSTSAARKWLSISPKIKHRACVDSNFQTVHSQPEKAMFHAMQGNSSVSHLQICCLPLHCSPSDPFHPPRFLHSSSHICACSPPPVMSG